MILDEAGRQDWRRLWVACVYELANPDFQRRAWHGELRGVFASFSELRGGWFDDLGFPGAFDRAVRDGLLTEAEVAAAATLHRRFAAYGKRYRDETRHLGDPDWAVVAAAGQAAWRDLRAVATPFVRAAMDDLEARHGPLPEPLPSAPPGEPAPERGP